MTRADLLVEPILDRSSPARVWPLLLGTLYAPLVFLAPVAVTLAVVVALSVWASLCKRLTLSPGRLRIDRPLPGWLGLSAPTEVLLDRVDVVRADGAWMVLRGERWPRGAYREWLGGDAQRFAAAVESQVRHGERQRRWGLTGRTTSLLARRGGQARCPYCHDALAGQKVELVAPCPECGTLHHAECFAELGRCATLGCAGRPRRVAA